MNQEQEKLDMDLKNKKYNFFIALLHSLNFTFINGTKKKKFNKIIFLYIKVLIIKHQHLVFQFLTNNQLLYQSFRIF